MAKIRGSKEGLKLSNKVFKKVEPIIGVEELKKRYLFGITIEDEEGNELPKESFQQYIDNAVSMLEHYLDISITPVIGEVEERDYRLNDYADWGYMQLNNFPVIALQKIELVYFKDKDGNAETVQEYPQSWYRLQSHDGLIRLIPNARFPANLQVDQTGNYFPEVLRSHMIPHAWRITYDHGFEDGKIPVVLNQAIGLLAAIQALMVAGNLVIGAGIAAEMLSIDGLSQTIQTTQSAENSAYSATIKEYQRLLFGSREADPFALLNVLERYYKGETINIL